MLKRILSLCVVFLAAAALCAPPKNPVRQRISDTAVKPVIDGVINDDEWNDAAVFPHFITVSTQRVPVPLRDKVVLMMKYDTENLYVALRTRMDFDPELTKVADDDPKMNTVDSLALHFSREGEKYWYCFMVERSGGKSDWRNYRWDTKPRSQWQPQWEYKARVIPDSYMEGNWWEGEIAIPWSVLEMKAPQEKTVLAAQLVRYHGNKISSSVPTRMSSWVRANHEWALPDPDYFGTLEFIPGKPVFRCEKEIENFERGYGSFAGSSTRGGSVFFNARVFLRSNFNKVFAKVDNQKCADGKINWRANVPVDQTWPAMWMYSVTDADGILCRTEALADIRPPFYADVQVVHRRDAVVYVGEITTATLPENGKIVYELFDDKGKMLVSQSAPVTAHWFEQTLPMDKLAVGTSGKAVARLCDASGKTLYTINTPVTRIKKPEWMNNHLGEVTAPFGPWEELKSKEENGKITLDIYKHQILFGNSPLPEKVTLFGKDFSSAPWEFIVETSSGKQTLRSDKPVRIVKQDKRGVTLSWSGRSAEIVLDAEIRVEFDGLAWYKVCFKPLASGIKVKTIALACPLVTEGLRNMRATVNGGIVHAMIGNAKTKHPLPAPALSFQNLMSGNGWIYGKSWHTLYWIGGEDRGMSIAFPSARNMKVKKEYSIAEEKGDAFDLRFVLIDTEVSLDKPLDYQFGLVLTPSRPIVNRDRKRKCGQFWVATKGWNEDGSVDRKIDLAKQDKYRGRFMRPETPFTELPFGYVHAMVLPCWKLSDVQCGNPFPPQEQVTLIRNLAKGIKRDVGAMPCLWYDALITTTKNNSCSPCLEDMRRYPVVDYPIERPSTEVCSAGCWPDYYLYGLKNRMADGIESLYLDMTRANSCSNRFHNCGYRDENGEIKGAVPYLAIREQFLRMQKMIKDKNPDGVIIEHGGPLEWNVHWLDIATYGEHWTYAKNYDTLSLEHYDVAYSGVHQLGAAYIHFASLIYFQYPAMRNSSNYQSDIMGIALLHGDTLYPVNSIELPGNMMVWNALDDFGADKPDAKFIPYWRNPMSHYPDGPIAVSSWERDGKQLIVVYNTSGKTEYVSLKAEGEFVNAFNGKPAAKNFEIPHRTFRMFRTK